MNSINFKELGIERVSFDEFMNTASSFLKRDMNACYENDSTDLLPVFSIKKVDVEQFKRFLEQNKDFHNEEESVSFDFSALEINDPCDVYFFLVYTDTIEEICYINH